MSKAKILASFATSSFSQPSSQNRFWVNMKNREDPASRRLHVLGKESCLFPFYFDKTVGAINGENSLNSFFTPIYPGSEQKSITIFEKFIFLGKYL